MSVHCGVEPYLRRHTLVYGIIGGGRGNQLAVRGVIARAAEIICRAEFGEPLVQPGGIELVGADKPEPPLMCGFVHDGALVFRPVREGRVNGDQRAEFHTARAHRRLHHGESGVGIFSERVGKHAQRVGGKSKGVLCVIVGQTETVHSHIPRRQSGGTRVHFEVLGEHQREIPHVFRRDFHTFRSVRYAAFRHFAR